ncbi:MAG TPA: TlyA family RNA methyltransferase [Candidatus Saccharimonadales bacterium]|nr:TlyA family RNA methyltransferase [Candidatus Saccharimonadales bacterium]
MKQRLDQALVQRKIVATRSQAESYIKLGEVKVDGRYVTKPGTLVAEDTKLELTVKEQYVSRAALKLASVAQALKLDFKNKTVLDVGSSTGGFTDYALQHGAAKVIAVESGTDQLHQSLKGHQQIELHEKTDIRDFRTEQQIDVVVADVSFVSLREILPSVAKLCGQQTQIVAMVKPQFEAAASSLKHKGVIKNDKMRRQILKDFEEWAKSKFVIIDKADSAVAGAKGNQERFYLLKLY